MANMNGIEVELRGGIPEGESVEECLDSLSSRLGQPKTELEVVVFFKYNKDMRLKILGDRGNLVLKEKGDSKGRYRAQGEYLVSFDPGEIKNLVHILDSMGYSEGLFSRSVRHTFSTDGVELCLKQGTPIGDFFEVEAIATCDEEIPKKERKLREFCDRFGLVLWTQEEFKNVRQESMRSMQLQSLITDDGEINSNFDAL